MKAFYTVAIATLLLLGCLSGAWAQVNATEVCGALGQSCCRSADAEPSCLEGSCLLRPGDLKGVCTTFGGVYLAKESGLCVSANMFTSIEGHGLSCKCPAGFSASCVGASNFEGEAESLCACITDNTADLSYLKMDSRETFAGWYARNNDSCILPNPLVQVSDENNGCACPAGWVPSPSLTLGSTRNRLVACQKGGVDGPTYGGLWMMNGATCVSSNAVTNGGCGCGQEPPLNPQNPIVTSSCEATMQLQSAEQNLTVGVCHVVPNNPTAALAFSSQFFEFVLRTAAAVLHPLLPVDVPAVVNVTQCVSVGPLSGCPVILLRNMTIQDAQLADVDVQTGDGAFDARIALRNVRLTGHMTIILSGQASTFDFEVQANATAAANLAAPMRFIAGRLWPGFDLRTLDISFDQEPRVILSNGAGPLSLFQSTLESAIAAQLPPLLEQNNDNLRDQANAYLFVANEWVVRQLPIIGLHDADGQPILIDFSPAGCAAQITADGVYIPLSGNVLVHTPAEVAPTTIPDIGTMLSGANGTRTTAALALTQAFGERIGHAARELVKNGLVLEGDVGDAGANATRTRWSFAESPTVTIVEDGATISALIDVVFFNESGEVGRMQFRSGVFKAAIAAVPVVNGTEIQVSLEHSGNITVISSSGDVDPATFEDTANDVVADALKRANRILHQLNTVVPEKVGPVLVERISVIWAAASYVLLQASASVPDSALAA